MARKRLYLDIETSPNIGMFWEAGFKKTIDYSNIIHERSIICICYKWEGKKEVHALMWDKKQSDKKMLSDFMKVAVEADELVGHNIKKFDMPWVRTRCLLYGIKVPHDLNILDTLTIAKTKFRFNSNRLNYIGKFLGRGEKIKTDFNLWKEVCLNNSRTSLDKMVRYCKRDVTLLEQVYTMMSSYVKTNVHWGMLSEGERASDKYGCRNCGSDDLVKSKKIFTAAGTEKAQYQCKTCHHYSTFVVTNKMKK